MLISRGHIGNIRVFVGKFHYRITAVITDCQADNVARQDAGLNLNAAHTVGQAVQQRVDINEFCAHDAFLPDLHQDGLILANMQHQFVLHYAALLSGTAGSRSGAGVSSGFEPCNSRRSFFSASM